MMAYFQPNRFLRAALFAVLILPLTALHAAAAPPAIAESPCDPAYFESLKAEAWKKAQAQITHNQSTIYKPRSVLELTCFEKYAGTFAKNSNEMMSGTPRWGTGDEDALTKNLNDTVGHPYYDYLDANFPKDKNDPLQVGSDRPVGGEDVIKKESYNCDQMNQVFQAAKCADFVENPETDGFYTDKSMAESNDKRQLPVECAKDSRWNVNMVTADPLTGPAEFVPTSYNQPTPGKCNDPDFPPLIKNTKIPGTKYNAGSCNIPGCHFDPPSQKCVAD